MAGARSEMGSNIKRHGLMLLRIAVVLLIMCATCRSQYFACPPRCQCYADPVDSTSSMHLICKWEQLNSSNLETISASDPVRTLTIRCPHGTRNTSNPPPGLFKALRNLDRLEINRCPIEALPNGLFQPCRNVQAFSEYNKKYRRSDRIVLECCTQMWSPHFVADIKIVEKGMTQLYSLIIRNARLTQLPHDIFADLSNLMALDLAGNDLRIEPYALSALSNLIQLDLSNNSISFLSSTLTSLHRLKVLSLDDNSLSNIDLRRVPNGVTDLTIRNNRINTLHCTFDSVYSLRRLDLAGNQMDFISSSGTVNVLPINLWSVDLTNNVISHIQDGAFSNMSKLTIVDLRNNSLNELREAAVSSEVRKHRLRILLSGNRLNCTCSLRWIVHASTKASPMVVDLADVHCSHILSEGVRLSLADADSRGELLCKYDASCAEHCGCCFQQSCYCRSICPKGCTCWHSATPHVTRMGRNIVECKGVRLDYLEDIPDSTTELRLLNGDWKEWSLKDIGQKRDLLVLSVRACKLRSLNESFLDAFPRLTQLDLSSNQLRSFPDDQLDGLADLHTLFLNDNHLSKLSAVALKRFTSIARLKLGGRSNVYECDCEKPTALQEWFTDQMNIRRVLDYENMFCRLNNHGLVRIREVNPAQNDTHCPPKQLQTVARTTTRSTTTTVLSLITQTISTRRPSTKTRPTRRRFSPTIRQEESDGLNMHFVFGYLMFFLVLLLVCLLFTIAATIYFRYCHMDRERFQKSQKRAGTTRTTVEQQPLNGF